MAISALFGEALEKYALRIGKECEKSVDKFKKIGTIKLEL